MGKKKEEQINPSKRTQDEKKDEDKEEIKKLYDSLALLRNEKNSWKRRARTMEKKRNEWKMICSFMSIILVILTLLFLY